VIDAVAVTLISMALVLAAWSALMTALKRLVGPSQLIGLAVAEVALLVQAVLAAVKLAHGERPDGGLLLFCLYLVGSLLLLPIAGLWGWADRSRWGSGVVVVGYLVMAVLIVRMQQVWRAPHV
jgi:hypothetical protein